MTEIFNLDKFVADRKELVERLYAEAEIEVKSFEDLLNLPVNEEYAKNKLKRQQALQNEVTENEVTENEVTENEVTK
jgi:hypothetical protein